MQNKWQFPKFEHIKRIGRKSNRLPLSIGKKLAENRNSLHHLIEDRDNICKERFVANQMNNNNNNDNCIADNKILSINNPDVVNCRSKILNKEEHYIVSEDVKDSDIANEKKTKIDVNVVCNSKNKNLKPLKISTIKISKNNLEKVDSVNLNLNNDNINNSFSSDIENINNYDCGYYSNLNTRLINIKSELSKHDNTIPCNNLIYNECSLLYLIFTESFLL